MASASNIRSGGAAVEFSGKLTNIDVSDSALDALTRDLDRKMGGAHGGWEKSLKERFGARSGLGELGGILAGGGAIAGLALLANGFEKVVEKIQEYQKWANEMKRSNAELFVQYTDMIPILGSFQRGLERLESRGMPTRAEIYTDTASRAADQKRIDEERAQQYQSGATAFDSLESGSANALAQGRRDNMLRQAGTDTDRQALQEQFATEAQIASLYEKKQKIIKDFPYLEQEATDEYERQVGFLEKNLKLRQEHIRALADEKELNDQLAEQAKLDADYAEREADNQKDSLQLLQDQIDETNKLMELDMKEHEQAAKDLVASFGQGSRGTFNPNAVQSLQVGNDMRVDVKALRDALDFIKSRMVSGQAGITWQ